jgi:C4-dicarboxylate-specific signal transduction histidine kinase
VHFSILLGRKLVTQERLLAEIAERKRAEESLRKAQDDLARISRITTMGELAASIAHEVNQPLSGIVINGNACLRWLANVECPSGGVEEARQAIERIIRDGKRAGDVILRLRNVFKSTPSEKTKVDVNEIIREVVFLLRSETEKMKVSLHAELAHHLPPVLGDPVQLQQVILNLMLNGAEAMGTITDRAREMVIRTTAQGNETVLVEVQDAGVGIKSEELEKIFEAFHTSKPGGMGMGLSISRSIVENHGGKLGARTNPGHGATLHFSIPQFH